MIKINESSGFLKLRNFCITVDYELLENIEEIILRNIDTSSPYNSYKILLKPNEKTIVKNYEFSTVKTFKEELNNIHNNINNFDIKIELCTQKLSIEITFNKKPDYSILYVSGSNVDLAYGKYFQLVDVLKRKRTFYWFFARPLAHIISLLSFCIVIGLLVDYYKIPNPTLIWGCIAIPYIWAYPYIANKIYPARILKLENKNIWYQNQTFINWLGLLLSFIGIIATLISIKVVHS